MTRFAVAYMNLFDNDLTIEEVTAETPEEAIWKHTKLQDPCWEEQFKDIENDLEVIREELFSTDVLAAVLAMK